jgi:UDP-N-acetylglucosamine 2-epimerase
MVTRTFTRRRADAQILVFTARCRVRALRRVLRGLRERADVRLQVLASGAHLSPAHGMTVGEIEADGFAIDARVEMLLDSDSARGTCSAMGLGLIGYGQELARLRPDLVVLLGDRFETLAMASACLVSAVPVAAHPGGEATYRRRGRGARHAVTKIEPAAFTSTEATVAG